MQRATITILLILFASVMMSMSGNRIMHLDTSNGMISNNVSMLAQDGRGCIWIATDAGVSRYDGYRFDSFFQDSKKDSHYYVTKIAYDTVKDEIRICDYFGKTAVISCSTFETALKEVRVITDTNWKNLLTGELSEELLKEKVSASDVTFVLQDRKGNLWVATNGKGVLIVSKKSNVFHIVYDDVDGKHTKAESNPRKKKAPSAIDRWQRRWTAVDGKGLILNHNDGTRQPISIGNDKYDNLINDIAMDSLGRLWVATYRGLATVTLNRDGSYTAPEYIKKNHGLNDRTVKAICIDGNGIVWMSHGRGLAQYDHQKNQIYNYDQRDGVPQVSFLPQGGMIRENGWISFDFKGGKCFFSPAEAINTQKGGIRACIVRATSADNTGMKAVDINDNSLQLPQDCNTITIAFSVEDITEADNVKYQYKLQGFDKEWINSWNKAGNITQVSYNDLPSGEYTFLVKARLRNNSFDDAPMAKFRFNVITPLWHSWLVGIACAVMLLAILLIAGKFIKKHGRRQNMSVEKREIRFHTPVHRPETQSANTVNGESPLQPTVRDKKFEDKLAAVINANITDDRLDIEFLMNEFGMSRSTLYRKIKGITGMSANELINKMRLEKAAELILQGYQVSEAAYNSGFNNISNFRKQFLKNFGVLPSEYRKTNNNPHI